MARLSFVLAPAALLVALIGVSFVPRFANARPKYARAESVSCAYCHTAAVGGGPRNYRGVFYGRNNHTFAGFDDVAAAKTAGVPVGPDADTKPASLTPPPVNAAPTPPPVPLVDPKAIPDFGTWTSGEGIVFVKIPAGNYRRGTTDAQREQLKKQGLWIAQNVDEMPARTIHISRPLLVGKYEVTQEQWATLMDGLNPSAFKSKTTGMPVDSVSWNDTQKFCKALTAQSRDKGKYRLPTEAEWEYFARAGSDTPFPLGANKQSLNLGTLKTVAWMSGTAQNKTHAVGTLAPNAWGLYDLLGNVWEWCEDGYASTAYQKSAATDPLVRSPILTERVLRGGCWFLDARGLRVALRGGNLPTLKSQYVGFRLVREL